LDRQRHSEELTIRPRFLQKTGNFVPELGSTIIDFKDYDPIADRRRIYNLPGVLRSAKK
jgi:hypothetical protein